MAQLLVVEGSCVYATTSTLVSEDGLAWRRTASETSWLSVEELTNAYPVRVGSARFESPVEYSPDFVARIDAHLAKGNEAETEAPATETGSTWPAMAWPEVPVPPHVEAQVIASRRDRKPAREVRSLTVRLDPELFEQLERAAAERDLPLSFMVAKALRDFLPRLLPVEDMLIVRPHDA
jgi:hypothetical protein